MSSQKVANNPLGSYPVLVDKNGVGDEIQVFRLDIGIGTAESRVSDGNPLPVIGATRKAAFATTVSTPAAFITSSYTEIGTLDAVDYIELILLNTTNKSTIAISFDSGSTLHLVVPFAQTSPFTIQLTANELTLAGGGKVHAKYLDSVSTTGALYISGVYAS